MQIFAGFWLEEPIKPEKCVNLIALKFDQNLGQKHRQKSIKKGKFKKVVILFGSYLHRDQKLI